MTTTTDKTNLRVRASDAAELVMHDLLAPNVDLDIAYERAAKLLDLIGELRIVDAMLERQATADAIAETPNEQALLSSITDMHALSSGALERIRGVARCALRALETEAGVRDLESIAEALTAIAMDADSVHNDVAVEAEKHGIQTISGSWQRRLNAMPSIHQAEAIQKGGAQ